MTSMATCVVMLLACGAYATGESHSAQIEGHGSIISSPPAAALEAMRGDKNTSAGDTKALELLDVIYMGHSLHAFWKAGDYKNVQKELVAGGLPSTEAQAILYAEVRPKSFLELLHHVGAKPGMKYYDLGSGTGKTVFAAWLLGLDATGVELVEKRWDTACKAIEKAEHGKMRKKVKGLGVNFIHGSFLDIDFSDADIVFSDSAMFSKDMMVRLAHVAQSLKPGTKIITTAPFPGTGFDVEASTVAGQTSRSLGTTWSIMTRNKDGFPPLPTPATHLDLTAPQGGPAGERPPASLIRQEPSLHADARMLGPRQGPIIGTFELQGDEKPTSAHGNKCSLAEDKKDAGKTGKMRKIVA